MRWWPEEGSSHGPDGHDPVGPADRDRSLTNREPASGRSLTNGEPASDRSLTNREAESDRAFTNREAQGDRSAPNPEAETPAPVEQAFAPFSVLRVNDPLGLVLTLSGELDLSTVPLLQEHLDRAAPGTGVVVIDLSGLEFIDSSGLQLLVQAKQQVHSSGGQLALVRGPRAVHRLFEITRLDSVFEPCTSSSAALRTARRRRIESRRTAEPGADRETALRPRSQEFRGG